MFLLAVRPLQHACPEVVRSEPFRTWTLIIANYGIVNADRISRSYQHVNALRVLLLDELEYIKQGTAERIRHCKFMLLVVVRDDRRRNLKSGLHVYINSLRMQRALVLESLLN